MTWLQRSCFSAPDSSGSKSARASMGLFWASTMRACATSSRSRANGECTLVCWRSSRAQWVARSDSPLADQPPLRLGGRILDNVCWELHAHHLLEKSHNLLRRATQLVGAYFQYLPTCSQQRKWQGRIGASGQDETQLGREMLHEIGEGAVNLRLGDQVIVVEDQEKLLSSAHQG